MASLADMYRTQGSAIPTISGVLDQESDLQTDAGLQLSRIGQQFAGRTLPGIIGAAASRGSLYGGQVGVRADTAKGAAAEQSADIQRLLARQLANLRRQGILAATGIGL